MSLPKKALLVGVNYYSVPSVKLNGCISDIVNMTQLLQNNFNYAASNISQLRDDVPSKMPTKAAIVSALKNLILQSAYLSEIWFHYSGHGSQVTDTNRDEADGLDEVIVPSDFQTNGFITDDEIFDIVKSTRCPTFVIFDSCHSGTMCDLQWVFEPHTNGGVLVNRNNTKVIMNPNVFSFSGCKDNQTSADAFSVTKNQAVGAFTDTFIDTITKANMNIDIITLYKNIRANISASGFAQQPSLSCSSQNPKYQFTRVNNAPAASNVTLVNNVIQVTPATKDIQEEGVSQPTKSDKVAVTMQYANPNTDASSTEVINNTVFMPMSIRKRTAGRLGRMF